MSWDVIKFKNVLYKIKNDGVLNGQKVKTLEQIYDIVDEELHINRDTFKGWGRPTSSGPNDDHVIRNIEVFLGLKKYSLDKRDEEDIKIMDNDGLSDINKQAIYRVYELMKDYIRSENVEEEECFSKMWYEIDKQKILIPVELYNKISEFIDNNLAPIIYERETTYAACYTADIGCYNKDGIWEVDGEDKMRKMLLNFMLKNIEIEEAIDSFALKELHPYLI